MNTRIENLSLNIYGEYDVAKLDTLASESNDTATVAFVFISGPCGTYS
jgi:hypothetical protein